MLVITRLPIVEYEGFTIAQSCIEIQALQVSKWRALSKRVGEVSNWLYVN